MDSQANAGNRLIHEQSPYLLQHAHNPVAWYPWGEQAFAEAARRNVPVLLSSGYASCHWCHVMARESFEDPSVAEALNQRFVAVKLDKEQRPDVDALYMEACVALNGDGGWPLNVFLLPDRRPFFAVTYVPPTAGEHGLGFGDLLQRISNLFAHEPARVRRLADALCGQLIRPLGPPPNHPQALAQHLEHMILNMEDPVHGGLGQAPKFPNAPILRFLLARAQGRSSEDKAWRMLDRWLNAMANGGIRDQIGHGFFRYATDRAWRIPHYEKMLSDNALLADLYLQTAPVLGPQNIDRARDALRYLTQTLLGPQGGFASSQDADDPQGEGAFYRFTSAEITALLGPDEGARFCSLYGLSEKHSSSHPHPEKMICGLDGVCAPAKAPEIGFLPYRASGFSQADESFAQKARAALFTVRERRPKPAVIALYPLVGNAYALTAFAHAAQALADPDYLFHARRTAEFIAMRLVRDGRLMGSFAHGKSHGPATLDGYGAYVFGLIALHQADPQGPWLDDAQNWAQKATALFQTEDGRLLLTGKDVDDLPFPLYAAQDEAQPSGAALLAEGFGLLAQLTGKADFASTHQRLLSAALPRQGQPLMGYASVLARV